MANSLLLDAKTRVSSRQLASAMLEAALLANERAGAIRLEVETDANGGRNAQRLVVVPGAARVEWPPATLEGRLVLTQRRRVADVVFDWLGTESNNPWPRAVEQGMIMLTVRGRAELVQTRFNRSYRRASADGASPDAAAAVAEPVLDLLAECRTHRPELWALLEKEIAAGFKRRKRKQKLSADADAPSEQVHDPDPWLDERVADQQRFRVGARPEFKVLPAWGYLLVSIPALVAGVMVVNRAQHRSFALATAGILTLVLGGLSLPIPLVQRLAMRSRRWFASLPGAQSSMEMPPVTTAQQLAALPILVPILTIIVVALREYATTATFLALGIPVGLLLLKKYRTKAGDAISQRVLGSSAARSVAATDLRPVATEGSTIVEAPVEAAQESAPAAQPDLTPVHSGPRLGLQIFTGQTLPEPSAASRARLEHVRQRAPAIRQLFRRGIVIIAGGTTLLAIAQWLAATRLGWAVPGTTPPFPWITLVLAAVTLVVITRWGAAVVRGKVLTALASVAFGPSVTASEVEIDESSASVRPVFLSIIAGVWVLASILRAAGLADALIAPQGRILAALGLVGAVAFLIWFDRARAAVERRFPYQPPQHLLALRVFGSPHLADFLDLTNGWQWIGTRLRLDGPGTSGQKARDLVNYFAGRIDKSIVEDDAELRAALAEFRERPDRQLRFPVNSIQCSNATWKDAVDHMIDRSDVVVMDLASLTRANRGVAYEISRLVARVELDRIILLIDYATDRAVLQEIVDEAWQRMPPNSPNRGVTNPVIRVFDLGLPNERQADESLAEWQQRQARGADRRRLLGLVVDAALPPRRANAEPAVDKDVVQWTRFPIPRGLRRLRNAAFYVFLAVQLLPLACQARPG